MKIACVILYLSSIFGHCQNKEILDGRSKTGPYSQLMKNQDGTKSVLSKDARNPNVIEKKTYANDQLVMLTVYRLDDTGNPLNCKIYDGLKQELFRSRYGYDKNTGFLVEEQMFDSRVKRIDAETREEMPVRRFIYMYDANGKQSKGVSIVLQPGKVAEELYKPKGQYGDLFVQPSGLQKEQLKPVPEKK